MGSEMCIRDSFNGDRDDWLIWSSNFRSALQRKKLRIVLDLLDDDSRRTPKDSETLTLPDGSPNLDHEKLKEQNRDAFSILKTLMSTKTPEGRVCWHMVDNCEDKTKGYKDGDFKEAWKSLDEEFAPKDATSVTDLKTTYNDKKMPRGQKPSLFIGELQTLKKRLKEQGHVIDDATFITCLLYTSPSPRDLSTSRMPSSA